MATVAIEGTSVQLHLQPYLTHNELWSVKFPKYFSLNLLQSYLVLIEGILGGGTPLCLLLLKFISFRLPRWCSG